MLPVCLKKAPLIDVVFEIAYSGDTPIAEFIPGVLHSANIGELKISSGPLIPPEIIKSNIEMRSIPCFIVEWANFVINIGHHNYIAISCKMPYPGWNCFKAAIFKILTPLFDSKLLKTIEKYSIKYTDFLDFTSDRKPSNLLNLNIQMIDKKLCDEIFSLQIELPEDNYTHIVNILSSANVDINDETKCGIIVDTDTIAMLPVHDPVEDFFNQMNTCLDNIHTANKELFFKIISPSALKILEPIYE